MVLPEPRSGESRDDFVFGRCANDEEIQKETSSRDQAIAICNSIWERSRNETMEEPKKKKFKLSMIEDHPTVEIKDEN